MNHLDLLKRAFRLTWRYKPLWLFGFILALCSGGSGGGGGNFNYQFSSADFNEFGQLPAIPAVDPNLIWTIIAGLICLGLVMVVISIVATQVSRAALMGMVRQIQETEAVSVSDGWRLGWSRGAWRLFLLSLLIGIPLAVISIILMLLALSPLLLLVVNGTAPKVLAIFLTVLAVLAVILLLVVVGALINPFRELAGRRTVLAGQGVWTSLKEAIALVKRRFRDVAIIWLLMFAVGLGWGVVSLVVVLPVSLLGALLFGLIPGGLVYLISHSWIGAAIAGGIPALLAMILIGSAARTLYLIFQSAVWTLTYLEVWDAGGAPAETAGSPPAERSTLPADA